MSYCFKQSEIENIIDRFGESFYEKVQADINTYTEKWNLYNFEFVQSYSVNCVFKCYSELYGHTVLKIGKPSREVLAEYNTLSEYNGRRFCKVYDADIANGIILEECIRPGHTLFNVNPRDQRIRIFCLLYHGLHIVTVSAHQYPAYMDRVNKSEDYISKRKDCTAMYQHLIKAKDVYKSISSIYSRKMLLHGDLHHGNILLNHRGEYITIDPKGVIGDPVFDLSRFILNEFSDTFTQDLYQDIEEFICALASKLHIPSRILKQCLYVETVIWACEELENGLAIEDCSYLINNVVHAEIILHRDTC